MLAQTVHSEIQGLRTQNLELQETVSVLVAQNVKMSKHLIAG